jgi:predicted Zn-dependent protease
VTSRHLVERALRHGRPGHDHMMIADETATVHLRWADNALTTNGVTRTRRLTVIAVAGGAAGTAAGVVSQVGEIDDGALRELVEAADGIAREATPAEDALPLVDGAAAAGWDEPPAEVPLSTVGDLAPALAEMAGRAAARRCRLYGYLQHQARTTYLASSTGLRLRHTRPAGLIDLTARADGAGTSWAGASVAELATLDLAALEGEMGDRLGWASRRVELPPGAYQVLLSPSCVADLMLHLYLAAGAVHAHDGHSVFGRPGEGSRIGERLTAAPLTLRSDPREPGLACAPFVVARASDGLSSVFDNGLPLGPTRWITEGRLSALVQTRHSAALTGQPATGLVDNLVLEGPGGGPSLAEMVSRTGRGLLLTSLWYLRDVDPRTLLLTGLTRGGVYLVERGEVVGEVGNYRFNESPIELLGRVSEIGRTVPALPREWDDHAIRVAMPSLRVDGFTMSAAAT